jgi:hypothetical protein
VSMSRPVKPRRLGKEESDLNAARPRGVDYAWLSRPVSGDGRRKGPEVRFLNRVVRGS